MGFSTNARIHKSPFRHLCKGNHCSLLYTKMVHTNHILNKRLSEISELEAKDENYPVSLQLVGNFTYKKTTVSAFEKIEKRSFKRIDFNLGCPSPKAAADKSGSFLRDDISVFQKPKGNKRND